VAIASVHIGNDNSFGELLRIPSYYTDLALSFGCTFGVAFYLRRLYVRLNRKYGWQVVSRGLLVNQLMAGIILPTLVIISIEVVYLALIHINLKDSSVFYLELPLVFVFCILLNMIYTMLYHRVSLQSMKPRGGTGETRQADPAGPRNFAVQSGSSVLNIFIDQVAYFIVLEKQTFLVVKDGKRYLYSEPVSRLEAMLQSGDFFRLNRQVVATRGCIKKYESTGTRRLTIELEPAPGVPVYVAKTKAADFGRWLQGK
jgi:hypothetical protein